MVDSGMCASRYPEVKLCVGMQDAGGDSISREHIEMCSVTDAKQGAIASISFQDACRLSWEVAEEHAADAVLAFSWVHLLATTK